MSADPARRADTAEWRAFLDANPGVSHVDAVVFDICGVARGKRYPCADVEKLFRSGMRLPYSSFFLDATGACLGPDGVGQSDGDPDRQCLPVPGTLVSVPWSSVPAAQVMMTMVEPDGSPCRGEPRNVAARLVERMAAHGFRPRVAFELEFYLLDPKLEDSGRPRPARAPRTGRAERETHVYGIRELEGFADFFRALENAAAGQGVPTSVATSEYAPGQYEVNLHYCDDAVQAADHCVMLRHLITGVAEQHGFRATFMSKPFPDLTGNGMHVHVSLLEEEETNAFGRADGSGESLLRNAIGGLAATMDTAMAFYAANVNAYRRFVPGSFTPLNRSWAENNRLAAIRIPPESLASRRVEVRAAGADSNPYLVLAAVLAGMEHGLAERIDAGPEWTTDRCSEADPTIPLEWHVALEKLRACPVMRAGLGADYVELYCETKELERQRFHEHLSLRELDWYL